MARRSPGRKRRRRTARPSSQKRYTLAFIGQCVIADHCRLEALPHVQSLAVGLKHKEGRLRRILSVTAFVDSKPDLEELAPEHRLPAKAAVLVPVGGGRYRRVLLPTDVVVIEQAKLHGFNVGMDPVRPGAGLGGRPGEFGTLGCYVADVETGQPLLLTCAHVVVADGLVAQPGGFAEPPPGSIIGMVRRWARTPFDVPQWMDAAAVDLRPSRGFSAEPSMCNEPRVTAVAPAHSIEVGMPVSKCGAATEGTSGTVTHYNVFPLPQGKLYGVLVIRGNPNLSASGDSGAVWRDAQGRAVGLHCAGTANGWAAAVPFGLALQAVRSRVVPKAQSSQLAASLEATAEA